MLTSSQTPFLPSLPTVVLLMILLSAPCCGPSAHKATESLSGICPALKLVNIYHGGAEPFTQYSHRLLLPPALSSAQPSPGPAARFTHMATSLLVSPTGFLLSDAPSSVLSTVGQLSSAPKHST